jgi:DNA-directed RNA polymerase specialized sigma24 family protein
VWTGGRGFRELPYSQSAGKGAAFQFHVATSELSSEQAIEPLTHCNLQGVPYERLPQVEQQIRSALTLSHEELLARAAIHERTDAYLQEEVLAYFIRRAHRVADDRLVNDLSGILVDRCRRVLRTQLRALGQDQLEEAVADIVGELFERLAEPEGSDRGDFFQVRFWRGVKPFRIAAFKRAIKTSSRELVAIDPTGAGAEEEDAAVREVEDPRVPPPDTRLLSQEALARLQPNVRLAFLLRLEGWPVEDQDPNVMTISRYFGKTSRTIRNWLAEAERQLAAWRDDEEAGS